MQLHGVTDRGQHVSELRTEGPERLFILLIKQTVALFNFYTDSKLMIGRTLNTNDPFEL